VGFFHGARIFESEGLRVGDLGAMIADISPVLGEMIKYAMRMLSSKYYKNYENRLYDMVR
jgi:hypothetical protein